MHTLELFQQIITCIENIFEMLKLTFYEKDILYLKKKYIIADIELWYWYWKYKLVCVFCNIDDTTRIGCITVFYVCPFIDNCII